MRYEGFIISFRERVNICVKHDHDYYIGTERKNEMENVEIFNQFK